MKRADLSPPLGYPGGPCFLIQRIEDEVDSQRLEDSLISLVESGRDLSNPQASQIYDIETEKGVWKFRKLLLSSHAQYRMDLRRVSVPEIRSALQSWFRLYNLLKSKRDSQATNMEESMMRVTPVTWTDPRLQLTIVFKADAHRHTITLITAYWEGVPDEKYTSCALRVASRWLREQVK